MGAPRTMRGAEGYVPVDGAELFYRDIGEGLPIVVVHGGPDFDHGYLLPDMDRLADAYRLIYYDQRGRGRSRGEVRLARIGIEQCVDDLDAVRAHLGLDATALLGHSWGGHLAMHYALRHPDRVSRLILMNTAPASHDDYRLMCGQRLARGAEAEAGLHAIEASAAYRDGEPQAVADYYKLVFATAFKDPALVERLHLTFPSREDVARGRVIEERLMAQTYGAAGFTVLPDLARLRMPTLIVHGEHDFVPAACVIHIAQAIPGARLVVIEGSGHFSYIDAPFDVHAAIDTFFGA